MVNSGKKLADIITHGNLTVVFLHNTDTLDKAIGIMTDGFRFENQLTFSADRIDTSDDIELNYFLVERKEYGKFTVIIEIARSLFNKYMKLAESSSVAIEDLLSVIEPVMSENDEELYTLSNYFVKAVFNNSSGEIIFNPEFDPGHDDPLYMNNYRKLSGKTDGAL